MQHMKYKRDNMVHLKLKSNLQPLPLLVSMQSRLDIFLNPHPRSDYCTLNKMNIKTKSKHFQYQNFCIRYRSPNPDTSNARYFASMKAQRSDHK